LPALTEQQRIVEILDRAAAIQRLRRAAEEKAREIIPALFVDMFGDPVTNPKGWPMRKLEDVATVDRGRSRHRPRDDKALYNGSYPFIQTSEVATSGGLIPQYTTTYSEFGLAQSKLWPSGTLCVTIAANIAKTGILQFAACFPDSVVAVIPGSTTNNEFLQAWLAFLQPTLEAQAPQLAQKNINLEILRALAVPMPPKSLQDKFSELCQRVRAMQALNDNSATVAISTNQSLASTLFSAA
jgi:type I restriction enzyme S subunit